MEQVSVSGAVKVSRRMPLGVLVSVGKDAVGVRLGGDRVRTRKELVMVLVTVMEESDTVSTHVRLAVGTGGTESDWLKLDSVRVGEAVSVPRPRSDAVHVPVWVAVGRPVRDEVPV